MKKVCTFLLAFALVLSCIAMAPVNAQAASESDLTFALNADGKSYCVTDCKETASGSLTIPATYEGKPVTSIGTAAFRYCAELTEIVIPDSVKTIGNAAFSHCSKLESINIPNGVTVINSDTFYKCFALASITIPDSVQNISHYAFYYCTSLTEVTIPENVTIVGEHAFAFCSKLNAVEIKGKLTKISKCTFLRCRDLRSITIPNGVTTIEENAFDGCLVLLNVGIPASVTSIGNSAFANMDNLFFVFYCGTEEQWNQITVGENNAALNAASRSNHKYTGGDCTTNMVCDVCGALGPVGHTWVIGTCTTPHYCSVCNVVVVEAPGHSWKAATCTSPKTCGVCGETEGEALGHSWKAATCTSPKTCTACGATEGDVQHTYDNDKDHICNLCSYERTLSDANLVFSGAPGLSFKEYIGLQILVANGTVKDFDSFYVEAVQVTPDGISSTTQLQGTSYYYNIYQKFEQQILSWAMTEEVSLTLYAVKDGATYQGQTVKASVAELAKSKLADYTAANNTKACTALVDMLNYGAAVQTAYKHYPESLPNSQLGEYASYATTEAPTFNAANSKTEAGIVAVARDSVSMQAKVEIQLLIQKDVSAYTAKASVDGTDAAVVVDTKTWASYGWTTIKVAVNATNMRDVFTIALYDAEGNAVTSVYTVSIEAYGQAQLGGTYNDVVIAMMKYGDAVSAI